MNVTSVRLQVLLKFRPSGRVEWVALGFDRYLDEDGHVACPKKEVVGQHIRIYSVTPRMDWQIGANGNALPGYA